MKTSETITKIAPAFVKAQAGFNKASKDVTNPFFKKKYADLNAYLDACSEGLDNNGLAIIQDTFGTDEGQIIKVSTRLIHSSGEWMESEPLVLRPTDMKPQSFGSAQTYGRRYSLASFLGLGAEDDDGNKASKPKTPPAPKAPLIPKRSDVNKALQGCKTVAEIDDIADKVNKKYGDIAATQTGHKSEIWSNLFETHYKRVNGQQPFDANEHPDDLQKRFNSMVDTADSWATYDFCEKLYNDNKALKVTANLKAIQDLAGDLVNRLGDR